MLTTTTTACTSSKYTILPHQANSGNWSLRNNTHCRRKLPKLIKTLHPWKTSLRNFHTAYTIFLSSLTLSKHSSPRLWRLANNSCCSAATRKDNQVRFSYRTKPVPLEEINGGATLALKHRRDWGLKAGGSPAATGACRHTLARRHRPGNRWAGPAAAEEHPHLTACALSNAPTAGGGDAGLAAQPSPAATLEGPNAAGQGERGGLAGGQSGGSSSSRRQPPLSDGPAAWPPPTHPAWPGLAPPRRARREEAGPPAPRRAAPSPLTRRARDRYRRRRRSACPAAALRSPPRPLFGPAPSAARAPACLFLFSSPQRHGRQRRRGLAGCRPPPQPIGRRGCPWVGTGGFSARRKRKGERGGRAKPSRGRRRGGTGKEPFVRGGEQEAGRLGPGPSAARPVRRRPAERRLQAAARPAGHGDQRRVHRGGEGGASVWEGAGETPPCSAPCCCRRQRLGSRPLKPCPAGPVAHIGPLGVPGLGVEVELA